MHMHNATLGTTALIALLAATPASAVFVHRVLSDQGGPACQLSVPTTSSNVRPRANGMRNEGTTNQFVICQYQSNGGGNFSNVVIYVASFDGVGHSFQCTGMNGTIMDGSSYVTDDMFAPATGWNHANWVPTDFGQPGPDFTSPYFSVTCLLPPGASILATSAEYNEDVGS